MVHLSHSGVADPVAIDSVLAPQGRVLMIGASPREQITTLTTLAQTGQRGISCIPTAAARPTCVLASTVLLLLAPASGAEWTALLLLFD